MMPVEVLEEAKNEFMNYKDSGMSIMEINHRSLLFNDIIAEAEADLRELLDIPNNYKVLFLQGGASLQFAAIPMNLMRNRKAGFVISGHWAKRAYDEAKMYGNAIELSSSADRNYNYIPYVDRSCIPDGLDYVHICQNNTIYGTQFTELPDIGNNNLVSDMSSCILSQPIDISRYALIFAGSQKNMGTAGTTVVIVREDLVTDFVREDTPMVLRYKNQLDSNSRYNTPSCYSTYICGKMFKWLKKEGGLSVMEKKNKEKAKLLYDFLDESDLFTGTAQKEYRSIMNVTFTTGNSEEDMRIVEDSKKQGFVSIKGHRFVGGLRASLYNAIPVDNVKTLVEYLRDFERCNG